jgi:hypothetical protein
MLIKVTVPAQKFREILEIRKTLVAVFEVIGYSSSDNIETWILRSDTSIPRISHTFNRIEFKKDQSSALNLDLNWQEDGKGKGALLDVSSVTVIENYPKP